MTMTRPERAKTRLTAPLSGDQMEISVCTDEGVPVIVLDVAGRTSNGATESVQLYLNSATARQVAQALHNAAEINDRPRACRTDTWAVFRF